LAMNRQNVIAIDYNRTRAASIEKKRMTSVGR
jgi:hypothetical protein